VIRHIHRRNNSFLLVLVICFLTGINSDGEAAQNTKVRLAIIPPTIAQAIPGLSARLDISGFRADIPMTVNADGTVSTTVENVPPGLRTFTITYRSSNFLTLATASGSVNVQANATTQATWNTVNTTIDDDGDGVSNLEEVQKGTNPQDPNSGGPQATLQVNLAGSGQGIVRSDIPLSIVCGSGCTDSVNIGSTIRLFAEPMPGMMFAGWEGPGITCGHAPECQFTLQGNLTIVATFVPLTAGEAPTFTLSIGVGGSGNGLITSDVPGINCGPTCAAFYDAGTTITLTATAAPGSMFSGWLSTSGCTGTGPCQISMTSNQNVTATFLSENTSGTTQPSPQPVFPPAPDQAQCEFFGNCSPQFPTPSSPQQNPSQPLQEVFLTVGQNGTGAGIVQIMPDGISCGSDQPCVARYTPGTIVTLTAIPNPDAEFVGWSGVSGQSCQGTGPCTFTMQFDGNVTATFAQLPSSEGILTVSIGGTGNGTVFSSPAGINSCGGPQTPCAAAYPSGTVVTLTATADPGSVFVGWSGAGCGGTGFCTITITGDQFVTVGFEPAPAPQVTLSLTTDGPGLGTITASPPGLSCSGGATCSETYTVGTVITLTATPQSDGISTFAGWTIAGCSGTGICQITMNENLTVAGTFNIGIDVFRAPQSSLGMSERHNALEHTERSSTYQVCIYTREQGYTCQ